MADAPKIDDAPGLTWRPNKRGWEARWRARTDLVKRGYYPRVVRLWAGREASELERDWIADRCRRLQAHMLSWARGGTKPVTAAFDGTLASLCQCYTTDKDSAYHSKRYRTRENYDYLIKRIRHDTWTADNVVRPIGDEMLADVKARTLLRWHEGWGANGRAAMGHALIGMLRTLFGFGATILEDPECIRLSGILSKMRFEMAKPRQEHISAEQAQAVITKAHEMGLHSVALAQAIQFECLLRQKDVIGEWVPVSEPGTSDVVAGNLKWLWGVRWSEIDGDLILRHVTSKRGKLLEVDLRLAPMVMAELARLEARPTTGPIIVSETRSRPYVNHEFRRDWRKVARAAGIPDTVYNMDSRAGGISEATDAGAELEHVRHAATHGNISMTQRYSRGSTEKIANVMQLRAKHRNKGGTSGRNEG